MATIERTYTIPLRSGYVNSPRYKRSPKAVRTLRAFLVRHMKSEQILIGPKLNEFMWAKGIQNPPPRVKVSVVKDGDIVKAELFGHDYPEPAKANKKEGLKERLLGRKGAKESKETVADATELVKEQSVNVPTPSTHATTAPAITKSSTPVKKDVPKPSTSAKKAAAKPVAKTSPAAKKPAKR